MYEEFLSKVSILGMSGIFLGNIKESVELSTKKEISPEYTTICSDRELGQVGETDSC